MLVTSTAHRTHIRFLLIVSIAFFVIMMFAFLLTAKITSQHSQLKIDTAIFEGLQSIRSSLTTRFMLAITFLGSRYFLFPCYTVLVGYFLLIRKKLWFGVALAFTGFLGNRLLFLMQDLFKRIRPAGPLINYVSGYGYPSGHSFASFVFAGLLTFLVWRKRLETKWKLTYTIIFFLIASIIAISRAYLHVHYPTDVLGGFYLSMLWLIPCCWMLYFVDHRYP
jgi:undecaprenyl-diphosphatase